MHAYNDSNALNHHGVKGMKWGVRKDPDIARQRHERAMAKAEDIGKKIGKTAANIKKHTTVGTRRYQDKDGNLTELGKKRYDRDIRENNAKKKDNQIKIDGPDTKRWAKEDMERGKKLIDAASSMNKELKNIERNIPSKKRPKMDLSKMTDQQMRSEINRALLERQYNDMFNPQTTSKGRQYAKAILDGVGTSLAITGSALGVALAIKELRG
jgi:hypothetical protein